jgi:hypothetical protein
MFLALVCSGIAFAGDDHQLGTAASGRASSGSARLVSILDQTAQGFSGDVTSGFLAVTLRQNYPPGDADGSGYIDVSDVIFLVEYIFGGGPAPIPLARGDADCSGDVDISDAVFLVTYIFNGGRAPENCW